MGEGSEGVGEGSVEGKHGHVLPEESERERVREEMAVWGWMEVREC